MLIDELKLLEECIFWLSSEGCLPMDKFLDFGASNTFVESLNEETGDVMYHQVDVDDGWGGMHPSASLDRMIREASSGDAMDWDAPHPDAEIWHEIAQNRSEVAAAQSAWRAAERAAGRDGRTHKERKSPPYHL